MDADLSERRAESNQARTLFGVLGWFIRAQMTGKEPGTSASSASRSFNDLGCIPELAILSSNPPRKHPFGVHTVTAAKQKPTRKAAAQIGISFTAADLDVHERLKAIHERTGIPFSHLVRMSLRATLLDDEDAAATLRAMKGFSVAAARAAHEYASA